MAFTNKKALVLGTLMAAVVLSAGQPSPSYAGPCLINASDTVGNAAFGATVGTFIGLGINPATTCI